MAGHRPILPPHIGGKLSDLIQDCWNSDPTRRPTATEICAVLDQIKCLDTHDGGFMHFAIAKKFLNMTRPTVHSMKRFFHLFGRHGSEDIETSEVEVVPQLDGAESSSNTPNIQGLPRYLCMDPSTFQLFGVYMDMQNILCKSSGLRLEVASMLSKPSRILKDKSKIHLFDLISIF
jgi:hypothetical protein